MELTLGQSMLQIWVFVTKMITDKSILGLDIL